MKKKMNINMKTKVILIFFVLFCCPLVFASEKPNIILILSDDMGYSDLGCYGGEIKTPQLDQLASGGVRFSQFYNTARCCPTRASLLTGLHPHQAGMGHMTGSKHNEQGYRGDLLPSTVTIAEALKTANYRNYCIGKWHVCEQTNSKASKHNWPLQRGFDRYYGILRGAANYFDPQSLVRDNTPISPFADKDYTPDGKYYLTRALADNAVTFIKDHKTQTPNQPFFLYVAFTAAHWPMQAPDDAIAEYKGKYDNGYKPIREARYDRLRKSGAISEQWELSPQAENWNRVENKDWESRCMEVYAAMISEIDRGVGRIVNSLKATGQYENTVILFLQDNGACAENIGRTEIAGQTKRPEKPIFEPISKDAVEPVLNNRTRSGYPVRRGKNVLPGSEDTFIAYGRGWANVSNTPFREYKHWVHEGGISTPLIIHAPSLLNESIKGKFYHEYGQLVDIMSTCVDLAGAKYPEQRNGINTTPMQGTSLKPALAGKKLARTVPLFWEHEGNRAIRNGKWKLVAKSPQGEWELYDIDADRSEMHNLADGNAQLVADLSKQWNDWANRSSVLPWPWAKPLSPKDKQAGIKFELIFGEGKELPKDSSGNEISYKLKGKPAAVNVAGKAAAGFDGKTWFDVEKKAALNCAETAWFVETEVYGEESTSGVIVSQGGAVHGYSLYLDNGFPALGVRLDGELVQIKSEKKLNGWVKIEAGITRKKVLQIRINGEITAEKSIDRFILGYPADSMVIAADLKGQIVEPPVQPFKGNIKQIKIRRGNLQK
ncbi:MAG: arylsulfatase [Planctomycetaceae bacterium]|jgi:arylsulfatase|nr:arylsulfatase [Planctomycetaceae bacterium]